jgi:DNA polymerase III subunit delta'
MAILPWHREPLQALIARGEKLPHALLVHGQSGIGKVEFAMSLAQSLLCEAPHEGLACGTCPACGWFLAGNHPDFRLLLPESLAEDEDSEAPTDVDAKEKKKSREIKIDQIRAIGDFMALSTHRNGYRVLVLHPAEAMNAAAANALLKTLEEPPPRSLIILVSDQLGRLLATIRSRCQRVLLSPPDTTVALAWLSELGVESAEDALQSAAGGPLDALAFADPDYQAAREAFVSALAESSLDFVQTAQHFEKAELANLLYWLQTWVGDLISQRMVGEVNHHRRHARAIGKIAAQIDLGRAFRYESELRQTRRLINHPLNARLLLEQLLIGYRQAIKQAR